MMPFPLPAARNTPHGGTSTWTTTVTNAVGGFTQDVLVPQFNPALGTLVSATVSVTYAYTAGMRFENLFRNPATVTGTLTTTISGSGPGVSLSAVNPEAWTASLARYDNVTDYAGTSGYTGANRSLSYTLSGAATPNSGWIGTGNATLTVAINGSGSISGTSSYSLSPALTALSITVTVTYVWA